MQLTLLIPDHTADPSLKRWLVKFFRIHMLTTTDVMTMSDLLELAESSWILFN